jgi:hypothetical protein
MKAIILFNPAIPTFELQFNQAPLYNTVGWEDEVRDNPESKVYIVEFNEDSSIYIENNNLVMQDVEILSMHNANSSTFYNEQSINKPKLKNE